MAAGSSVIHQTWCGHAINCNFSAWKPPLPKSTLPILAGSTSSSCFVDRPVTMSAPAPTRFSHLSPLLPQLLSSSSAEVPLILEPWIPLLSADDWKVLIADVGPKNWSSSLQVFYTLKQKSSLWHELLHESKAEGEGANALLKVCTTLVRILGKNQRTQEIATIQEQMKEENIVPDAAFYNAIFASYAAYGHADEIRKGLHQMEAAGIKPDHLTHELLITALLYGEAPDLDRLEHFMKNIIKEGMPVSANTFKKLINAFWEAEDVEGAERIFSSMQDAGYLPDLKVINKLMQLHGRKGNYERNLELFNFLKHMGIKQIETAYGFLVHSYCKAGLLREAQEAFRNYEKVTGSRPSLVTFNMIMDACGKYGLHEEALKHYGDLCNTGLEPNVVSYCSIISAMVHVGKYKKAEHLYKKMLTKGIRPNLHIYLTMIHCYTKCKATRLGHELYFTMRKSRMKMTATAYSTVLALYVGGRWYDHAAKTMEQLEREGFKLDGAAHGLLIRAVGNINDDMAPLVQTIEASQLSVCKLLTSLSLTKREGPKMSSTILCSLIGDYFERLEAGDGDAKSNLGIYNAFLDCLWQRGLKWTAKILLERARKDFAASTCPKMLVTEWILDVRRLSVGGSKVAVAEWLNCVKASHPEDPVDDKKMVIITGVGDFPHVAKNEVVEFQNKGLKGALLSMLQGLGSPFMEMPENPTALEASVLDVLKWISGGVLKKEMALVDCL